MKFACAAVLAASLALPAYAETSAPKNPLNDGETWAELRGDVVGDEVIADGAALFDVDAPYRAHDAATVPVHIRQLDDTASIESAIIVIDENPAPVAAELNFGPSMAPLDMEVRVRVNMYSNVRVIAKTDAGLAMNGRFVKASGGCSAPATKDPELALASMGQMRLKYFEDTLQISTPRREAQIMIRHPNYSGLQRDQVTQLFISAHFIDTLEVFQGDDMLFTMEGGISISENPVFRFSYSDNGTPALLVRATDTEGNVFEQTLIKAGHT
ncbi:quinoprotein dehydrogenase-associated SoxYZ-like carrier [Sedimentitalea todarodis]|uniref:Quinoprotein dehydrogenase-associated SoxYZ-like carrier n=1 Tax=Sedimentitalea todarodis TaxID=1631240 RepID=A0ABU3VI04_9RHOB|nr:quinoprotein dehydrogenase-associated SoxYZ-like carrier [Sedimentitalea todarodis]MDU9005784.1 quinoprotein dehydrogenase-associated SoxYZ-like carrier [Sedimentitalea todarodis]